MHWFGRTDRRNDREGKHSYDRQTADLKLLGGELGQQETEALLEGDTVTGVLVIGREAGRVSRLSDLAGGGELLLVQRKK